MIQVIIKENNQQILEIQVSGHAIALNMEKILSVQELVQLVLE